MSRFKLSQFLANINVHGREFSQPSNSHTCIRTVRDSCIYSVVDIIHQSLVSVYRSGMSKGFGFGKRIQCIDCHKSMIVIKGKLGFDARAKNMTDENRLRLLFCTSIFLFSSLDF